MDRFRKARDKGSAYLLAKQRPDGSFGEPSPRVTEYYKVISAFQVCGETAAANRLCNWIRTDGITAKGDFGPRPDEADAYYYVYYNTWVILGAHRIGQFDLSEQGMEFLMGFWDAESGGFYSSPNEREENTLQDLWVVSGCAQAALCTGRIGVARSAGLWMERLMRLQPNYPKQLYSVYNRKTGLITDLPTGDDIRYVMASDAERDQYFFHPGIAAGFLSRLYQATSERRWLDLAIEYMLFAEGANEYLFRLLRAGKVGWAASILYTLTRSQKYREMALKIGDNIIDAQKGDGYWNSIGFNVPNNDTTAEMVVWLDEIYQAVEVK